MTDPETWRRRDDEHEPPGHPKLAGALLMIGTVLVIFVAALISSWPR